MGYRQQIERRLAGDQHSILMWPLPVQNRAIGVPMRKVLSRDADSRGDRPPGLRVSECCSVAVEYWWQRWAPWCWHSSPCSSLRAVWWNPASNSVADHVGAGDDCPS